MADSVKTTIRKQLQVLLQTIRVSNGYLTNVGEVNTEDVDINNLKNFPAINIVFGAEEVLVNQDSQGHITKSLSAVLDCYLVDNATLQTSMENLLQDIEKCLLGSEAGYSINGNARELMIISNQPFYLTVNKPNGALQVNLKIWYAQSQNDPTVKV